VGDPVIGTGSSAPLRPDSITWHRIVGALERRDVPSPTAARTRRTLQIPIQWSENIRLMARSGQFHPHTLLESAGLRLPPVTWRMACTSHSMATISAAVGADWQTICWKVLMPRATSHTPVHSD